MVALDEHLLNIDPDCNYFNDLYNSVDHQYQSDYFNVDGFVEKFKSKDKFNFTIVNFNIRSFNRNGDKFIALLDTLSYYPDVIVLTETWLNADNKDCANIDGYSSYHTVRNGRSGGVSIFCRSGLQVDVYEHLSVCNDNIETLVIKVEINNEPINIFALYRPHSENTIDSFSVALQQLLANNCLLNTKICLTGDFNFNLLDHDSIPISEVVNSLHARHFLPVITKPTHFSPISTIDPTLLDQVWINYLDAYTSGIILTDITDHCPAFICIKHGDSLCNSTVKVKFRLHSEHNINKFNSELSAVHWSCTDSDDVNVKTSQFMNRINKLYDKCFPIKIKYISIKRIRKPWLTSAILKSIKTKANYFKLYKLGVISKAVNDRYRNCLYYVIRKAKKLYYQTVFDENKTNIRKTRGIIKKLISAKRDVKSIKSLVCNNIVLNNETDMANVFNNFFCNIANDIEQEMQPGDGLPPSTLINSIPVSFYLFPVTAEECKDVITKLKNTKGHVDNISVRIFKSMKLVLAYPVAELINCSFATGIFPDSLKIACVTPIYKSGDPLNVTNYRPISILPLLGKVFEKCMASRINSFLSKNSLISSNQFGFQKNKSTVDALISLTEFIYTGLNNASHSLSIFIDLRKAFDTVQHSILVEKLQLYGFRGLPLEWIRSYLEDRKQCVKVGSSKSDYMSVNVGIPQGSILGPILFINDLPLVSDKLHSILFADDTTLSMSDRNYHSLITTVNKELEKINVWLLRNRLSLNVEKTFSVLFTNKRCDLNLGINVVMDGSNIQPHVAGRFLGVEIDDGLSFGNHIHNIAKKVAKNVGIIFKLQQFVPQNVLLNLYYSLVYPYLIYCNIIWGDTSETYVKELRLLQKKLVRIITHSEFIAHTTPLFYSTKILKIEDIHIFLLAIHAYKINVNNNFNNFTHNYNTRNRNYAIPSYQRLALTQHSVSFAAPKVWNSLPDCIKQCNNLSKFKTNLKEYLISMYD
jgi:exonuclease III